MSTAPRPAPPPLLFRADVRAHELPALLEAHAGQCKILSLDCFDTLLWRDVHQPIDVFFDLAREPAFTQARLIAQRRIDAEVEGRRMNYVRDGSTEVTLAQIYSPASLKLDLAPEQFAALLEAELAAEEKALQPFPPVVELLRAAKSRGMQVCVVSDTYLEEKQLRRLLAHALGDTAAMIDRVFVSCELKRSKSTGAFEMVLQRLGADAGQVLHVGDNTMADFFAPRNAGLHAAHLIHHDQPNEQILRMQAAALSLQRPAARGTEGIPSPFRALLSAGTRAPTPENLLGYSSLGPLLYSFGRFILDDLAAMRAEGRQAKPLFLLRDGYLPQQVCNALAGEPVGAAVCLSRFVSQAAVFRQRRDIEEYLIRYVVGESTFEPIRKQLMLPDDVAEKMIKRARASPRPGHAFLEQVMEGRCVRQILERSKSFRGRLYQHLKARAKIERGDTLMFVDLGYAGTAARLLGPMLKEEWDIDVVGRYLMAVPAPGWERNTKGLIDASSSDPREIFTLMPNVCILEDLCTTNLPSATGFDEAGEPIDQKNLIDDAQFARLKPIQEACVDFARDAKAWFTQPGLRAPGTHALKATGLASLTRLLFFPGEPEITCLEGFQFDVNLATSDTFRLFNRAQGLLGLQRRGLPAMEQHEEFRTNYPVELRAAHLSLAMTVFAADRFSLSFNRTDLSLRREKVPVIFLRGADNTTIPTDALATFDGFFSLIVPLGDGSMKAGVLFGQNYSWLQLESVQAIPMRHLFSKVEARYALDVRAEVKFEQMAERGPGIFECAPGGFLLPGLPKLPENERQQLAVRIVYRPLAARAKPAS